jgi:hypothetical protein
MKGERDSLRSWPLSVLVEDEGVVARVGRGGFAVRNPPMDWHAFDAVVVGSPRHWCQQGLSCVGLRRLSPVGIVCVVFV